MITKYHVNVTPEVRDELVLLSNLLTVDSETVVKAQMLQLMIDCSQKYGGNVTPDTVIAGDMEIEMAVIKPVENPTLEVTVVEHFPNDNQT